MDNGCAGADCRLSSIDRTLKNARLMAEREELKLELHAAPGFVDSMEGRNHRGLCGTVGRLAVAGQIGGGLAPTTAFLSSGRTSLGQHLSFKCVRRKESTYREHG